MECKSLPNQGYVEGVLKKSERDYLWSLIGEIDITDEKKKQKQLTDIDNEFANTVLMPYVQTYVNEFGVPFKLNTTHSHDLCLNRFWSRISTEGDYQSIHDHQSVFTFVVWLKIPFDGNKERNIQARIQTRSRRLCISVSRHNWSTEKEELDTDTRNGRHHDFVFQ